MVSEYFRSGANKVSLGSDAVYGAEEYLRTGVLTF
ncbi:Rab3 GTPase-activating protein catalytic subunit [Psidium guajava]|nr:Rab3 GTPase-activating protein catalytic subunit [Psidium guajava]